MSKPIRRPQADEQIVLEELQVELVNPEDLPRFQSLLRRHHYLGGIRPVGERLYYVAAWRGQWLALLVFCAAAKHLRHREKWIGWTEGQRRKRLGLVTNNARFLVLPRFHYPNLATRVMGLCLARLGQDWQARYAHPVWLAESFIDTQLFRGTAYKASGWSELGPTQGYGRSRQDYYVKHDRPKALLVKELKKNARRSLCADHLPAALAVVVESKVPPLPAMGAARAPAAPAMPKLPATKLLSMNGGAASPRASVDQKPLNARLRSPCVAAARRSGATSRTSATIDRSSASADHQRTRCRSAPPLPSATASLA